jgi:hypothetical protein
VRSRSSSAGGRPVDFGLGIGLLILPVKKEFLSHPFHI